jgi:hypothetical protein
MNSGLASIPTQSSLRKLMAWNSISQSTYYVRLQSQQGASQDANRDAEIDHNARHVN